MRVTSFVEYTTAGAVAGAAFTGLGAVVLHPLDRDHFQRVGALTAGLIGGAVTHAAYGVASAFDGEPGLGRHLRGIGKSLPIAALTSGLLGGALLGLGGYHDHPTPAHLIAAGVVGGLILGSAATGATLGARIFCCKRPGWAILGSGDLERGEALMAREGE